MKKTAAAVLAFGIGFLGGYSLRNIEYCIREMNVPQHAAEKSEAPETPKFAARQQVEESAEALENIIKFYKVEKVIDGDTLDIEGGVNIVLDKVRLLGINTPERGEFLYKEAKQKLEDMVSGKLVYLEMDKDNTDKYGRLLRYAVVEGINLNIEMVRLGYAKAFMCEGLRYEKEILAAEQEAKENKRGVWQTRVQQF